jgi:hypothetical protein
MYELDLATNHIRRVAVSSDGENDNSGGWTLSINGDGRYIALQRLRSNSGQQCRDIWMHDDVTGATVLADRPSSTCSSVSDVSGSPAVSADGRLVAYASNLPGQVAGVDGSHWQVYLRDLGSSLGVGGLAGSGRLSFLGAPLFPQLGYVSITGPRMQGGLGQAVAAAGGELTRATVAYRSIDQDLFVRLELQRMPQFALASPAFVYGLNFTADGRRYQVRVGETAPMEPAFGLFGANGNGTWAELDRLRGGYGTTGEEVVATVPLRALGLDEGGQVGHLQAFAAIGSYLTGPAMNLNQIEAIAAGERPPLY